MIIPAIDLIDGNVVRLYQGRYDNTTQYDFSPIGLRNQYAQARAASLHQPGCTLSIYPALKMLLNASWHF